MDNHHYAAVAEPAFGLFQEGVRFADAGKEDTVSKHHVTLLHHTANGVKVHQRTYDARNTLHALDQLRQEISRDEQLEAELLHAKSVYHHVHREE